MRRLLTTGLILALLATNVLAFTSAAFVSAISAAASAVGLTTTQARQAAARKAVARRIAVRTARGAARSLGGAVAQSLPVVGAAAVVGLTAWEIADHCATLEDLAALEPGAAPEAETVCGMTPPTVDDVRNAVRARLLGGDGG